MKRLAPFLSLLFGIQLTQIFYSAAATTTITLDDYLNQVKSNHSGLKSAINSADAKFERKDESSLHHAPTLFGSVQRMFDQRQSPFFRYDELKSNAYVLGLSQSTQYGVQGKLYYTLNYTEYKGLPSVKPYYEGRPSAELSVSLMRNFLGNEIRSHEQATSSEIKSQGYQQNYVAKSILANAENAYWRLALARNAVAIQKEALSRAERLSGWSKNRANLQLADRIDSLQSQSNLELRRLELDSAIHEERASRLAFNLERGAINDEVVEDLELPKPEWISELKSPPHLEMREDVRAVQEAEFARTYRAKEGKSRLLPTLDLYGAYTYNSNETTQSEAFKQSFKSDRPTLVFGLRFEAPLDIITILDSRSGWQKENMSATQSLEYKIRENQKEWDDLTHRFEEAKNRLRIAKSIELAQSEKLKYERERLTRGRTTSFQVIQFEQDLLQAQWMMIQIESEILQTYSRLKTFGATL